MANGTGRWEINKDQIEICKKEGTEEWLTVSDVGKLTKDGRERHNKDDTDKHVTIICSNLQDESEVLERNTTLKAKKLVPYINIGMYITKQHDEPEKSNFSTRFLYDEPSRQYC